MNDLKINYRGSVVTLDCVEKLLKKDMLDPINSKPMKESDIIPLKVKLTKYCLSFSQHA